MRNDFNAVKVKEDCVSWIRDWFEQNGRDCKAVIGLSGGKDSNVVAALCTEALGKDRVIGVSMPNGKDEDWQYVSMLVEHLDIAKCYVVDIHKEVNGILRSLNNLGIDVSAQTKTNLPARVRMTTLYAISQSCNGRVANTCNLSEDWVGYSTRYGDSAGDFSPLANLTVSEVKAIGYELGLPKELIEKTPSDGLCGKTDEDNLGFSYAVLDKYIRTGKCKDDTIKNKIDSMHIKNLFKLQPMPSFTPEINSPKKNKRKRRYWISLFLYMVVMMVQYFLVESAGIGINNIYHWLIALCSFLILEIGIFMREYSRS